MQLDCLTAESPPSTLSDLYIVPNTISLCPSLTFLFLSTFYSPACCCFSPPMRFLLCPDPLSTLPPSLCSPPLSPSSCLVFSWAVCWVCCWWELCTTGHKGMKIFCQAAEFTRLKMHRKHLPPKTVTPTRPTSNVSSKYQIPSIRRTSRIQKGSARELWPFNGEGVVCFFQKKKKRQITVD